MHSQVLRSDNRAELLDEVLTQVAEASSLTVPYIQPGRPNQNAYIERFNRTLREEVLNQYLLGRFEDVRETG